MDKQNSGKKQNKQKASNKNRKNGDNKDNSTTLKASSPPQSQDEIVQQKTPPSQLEKIVNPTEKTREEILAERELKKQSKLAAKNKSKLVNENVIVKKLDSLIINDSSIVPSIKTNKEAVVITEKTQKQLNLQKSPPVVILAATVTPTDLEKPKATTSKAERRALQEAQRAAKAKSIVDNNKKPEKDVIKSKELIVQQRAATKEHNKPNERKSTSPSTNKYGKQIEHRVKLFNHLYPKENLQINLINSSDIHSAVIRLGIQYEKHTVVGSNARCIAFMNAMKSVIKDYKTPLQKDFARGIEFDIQKCMTYLQLFRPISVSIVNALKFIKLNIKQLPTNETDEKLRDKLLESIETYIRDQIEKATEAICCAVQAKISNGDVILTFGCSSLIEQILVEAKKRRTVSFQVIVVDSRPLHEGQEMLRRLIKYDIHCTCVLINAVSFIMPAVTKVLLGAHALLTNGYVMSRCGTAQVALIAKSYNVPVLVCCETHKFSERVQTDAFVFNEISDPMDLVCKTNKTDPLANWLTIANLTPLHLRYDITPPELVTAVVTEIAILPCTSVPVILRIKPSEIGY